jgi:hypothetical protein
VVLYFFAPHRCKGADIAFLGGLKGKVSIVPVLAKADTMTSDELAAFKRQVREVLRDAGVPTAYPPVPVICASRPAAGEPRGREYPWGIALSEGGFSSHSELADLRQFLLIDGLLQLKAATKDHYESYRVRALRRQRWSILPLFQSCIPALIASVFAPGTRSWALRQLSDLSPRLGQGLSKLYAPLASLKLSRPRRERLPLDNVVPPPPLEPPPPPGRRALFR